MSFKVCNLGSKRPHLHSAYVLGVYNNLGTTVQKDETCDEIYLSVNFLYTDKKHLNLS